MNNAALQERINECQVLAVKYAEIMAMLKDDEKRLYKESLALPQQRAEALIAYHLNDDVNASNADVLRLRNRAAINPMETQENELIMRALKALVLDNGQNLNEMYGTINRASRAKELEAHYQAFVDEVSKQEGGFKDWKKVQTAMELSDEGLLTYRQRLGRESK